MSDLKVQYAEFMVARIKAAIADGDKFSIRFRENEKWVPSSRVEGIELDAGAIIIDVRGGSKLYLRYDQLIRVSVDGPAD